MIDKVNPMMTPVGGLVTPNRRKPKPNNRPLAGLINLPSPVPNNPQKTPVLAGMINPFQVDRTILPQILAGKVLPKGQNDASAEKRAKILEALNKAVASENCESKYRNVG